MSWYKKYVGFPYKHLGEDPISGIDCFNLCTLIYKQELEIDIPYRTKDFCNIIDEDWYSKTHERWMERAASDEYGWLKVKEPKLYDVILMSLGATNVTNHCALYVDRNKILQTMIDHTSWIAPYGRYYQQYTVGIYRWKSLVN
jgi:cell wall-associated NlpC family hydrolase